MGGFGSGRHHRWGGRPLVEQCVRLDVRQVHRQQRLVPGMLLHVETDTTTRCPLVLDWTPCTFGGRRPWWRCPRCARRVAVVYRAHAVWGCRRCLGLVHGTTRADALDRAIRATGKLAHRLGTSWELLGRGQPVRRPRGMHVRTFARLLERLRELEANAEVLFSQGVLARSFRAYKLERQVGV